MGEAGASPALTRNGNFLFESSPITRLSVKTMSPSWFKGTVCRGFFFFALRTRYAAGFLLGDFSSAG
jgi:hypothetical protein